ncbi:acylneuraminate cytidylyltransferase family protein [Dyadobacter psychrotolerans]|uniref:Acylneuraminate cytidylyltransferase family protein n=1 Tax=Dyadobacter psychrotolerans TaxID=2541721 RepID=A0A4R5DCU6_9BACT|nr:acylneuraminate cytidylyltransferase family protein [Dyadobacter psychrotolerans]TDE11602.1 acylneuraminate cytidylyltransferase family protein [Dyadobacter psychrotolerans]
MDNKPRILAIIPARAGSKGIPGKNLRLLAGKPLLCYTIESALASREVDTILLSTDSIHAIDIAKSYPGIEVPFVRPDELALDNTPTIEVVKHAINYYLLNKCTFDYVCILQPTTPFRQEGLIDKTIRTIIKTKADSLTTVRRVPPKYNPHWTFKMDSGRIYVSTGDKHIITRRQDLPEVWYRDGQVYIATIEQIKKDALLGGKMVGFENENGPDINIDTIEDWELAEQILANG